MNEHSISYMQKCMAHDFNDYKNLVICRDLLAQISKRPMPQGMVMTRRVIPMRKMFVENVVVLIFTCRNFSCRFTPMRKLRRCCILTMNALPPMRLCRRMTL